MSKQNIPPAPEPRHPTGAGDSLALRIGAGYWRQIRAGESKCLFVRTESPAAFGAFVGQLQGAFGDDDPWLYRVDLGQARMEAYFPFLSAIARFIEDHALDPDEVCTRADLYPSHRTLFRHFFGGGGLERAEEPIIDEIVYERRQMLRSLAAMLAELSTRRPLVLAFDRLHAGTRSLWRLMQFLHQQAPAARLFVVAAFSGDAVLQQAEEQNNSWNDFIGYVDEYCVVVDLAGPPALDAAACAAREPDRHELTRQTRIAQRFLAFEEAAAWGAAAYELWQEQGGGNAEAAYVDLLADLGDAHHDLFAADEALFYYEQMLQIAQERADERLQVEAYRRMALACMNKHAAETAVRYGQLAIECAARVGDEPLLFLALLSLFIVEDKFTRTIEAHHYRTLNALAERCGGPNTRVYLLNMSYLYREYYGDDFQVLIGLNDRALALARSYGNEFALAVGFHKRSILFSQLDDHEHSFSSLAESESIRSRLGDKLEIVRACNGIGYLSLIRDDYPAAFAYFNKAVQLFGSLRDYNEISMTLYNLASVHFRVGQYQMAAHILEKVLQVMSILGITHIPFRDITSIYAMKGLCHYKLGDWIKGAECLSRIGARPASQDPETNAYFGVLRACQAVHDGRGGDIPALLDPVLAELSGSIKAHKRLLPWIHWEYAALLRAAGDAAAAGQRFALAAEMAQALSMPHLADWIARDARGETLGERVGLPPPGFDLEALVALARQEVTLKKLHHVVRNMKFLHSLQTQLARSGDPLVLAGHFIRLVMSSSPAQLVAVHVCERDGWRLLSAVPETGARHAGLVPLIEALRLRGPAVYLKRGPGAADAPVPEPVPYQSLINLHARPSDAFGVNLLALTFEDGPTLAKDEVQVMSIALNQLAAVLEKIRHEQRLLYLSTVDELTGLANRQALLARLQDEIARAERYRSHTPTGLSVGFIDLDNFKYYNDRFGHDVGDRVIREFGQLIRGNVRACDFVARYGGDEFVVLLPETDIFSAAAVMQRVVEDLPRSEAFREAVFAAIGYDAEIPDEKRLTCSAGVAGLGELTLENGVKELLKRADHALYQAKRSGKNQVGIWGRGGSDPAD